MRERYNAAFAQVKAPDHLREQVLAASRPNRGFRYVRRLGTVAAILLLTILVSCGTVAVIYGDSLQSWFGYHWERVTGQAMNQEQTALIDHLSQEVGLTQTQGKVTVEVDSGLMGDNSFCLLLRVEGVNASQRHNYGFEDEALTIIPDPMEENGGMSSYGMRKLGIDGDGAILLLLEYEHSPSTGFRPNSQPLEIGLALTNLQRDPHSKDKRTLQEGTWDFSFSLDRSEPLEVIFLPDTEMMGFNFELAEEVPVPLTDLELTSTGLRFCYQDGTGSLDLHLHDVYVVLNNGARILANSGSGSVLPDRETMSYTCTWEIPVDLDQVSGVDFRGTSIPVP